MPNNRTAAAFEFILLRYSGQPRAAAMVHGTFTDMIRTTLRSLTMIAVVAAITGCQTTATRFAWWKHDKAPEDSSAVARSAKPALPSAQSKPEAVAIAGLTPAVPPSSTNLAAAGALSGALAGATAAPKSATAASVPIPVTSSTALANAPSATYPSDNGLADKLVTTPSSRSAAAVPSAAPLASTASSPAAMPSNRTAGPYDPNAYMPTASMAATGPSAGSSDGDRYAINSLIASSSASTVPNRAQPLSSDPVDRYGYTPTSAQAATAMPNTTPLMDPGAVAADRYSNPTLPTLPNRTAQASTSPSPMVPPTTKSITTPAPAVKLASGAGQYRPGRTSTYSGAPASAAIEVASRPAPPAATIGPAPTASPAGSVSQPWTPPTTTAPAIGTRTY